jgi:hypothetical protein
MEAALEHSDLKAENTRLQQRVEELTKSLEHYEKVCHERQGAINALTAERDALRGGE